MHGTSKGEMQCAGKNRGCLILPGVFESFEVHGDVQAVCGRRGWPMGSWRCSPRMALGVNAISRSCSC